MLIIHFTAYLASKNVVELWFCLECQQPKYFFLCYMSITAFLNLPCRTLLHLINFLSWCLSCFVLIDEWFMFIWLIICYGFLITLFNSWISWDNMNFEALIYALQLLVSVAIYTYIFIQKEIKDSVVQIIKVS